MSEALIRLSGVSKVYESHASVFLPSLGGLLTHAWSQDNFLAHLAKHLVRAERNWLHMSSQEKNQAVRDFLCRSDSVRVVALWDFKLEFHEGEFSAVAGPSGSGKSTLLNLIGTLDLPTSGSIYFRGRDVTRLGETELSEIRLRELGFIFQAFNLIPVLSALENVEYVLRLQGIASSERRRRAWEALEMVGLGPVAHRRPQGLSGGQQQRGAVARAIVHHPAVVLADEPTANLDSKTAGELLDLMQKLNEEKRITFIFSSHDPRILSRAGRIIQIRDGQILSEESGAKSVP